MRDPFAVAGPAAISFSGGRTSGYMLRRLLDAGLQPDVAVLFANTGKEREETLRFVHAVETRWAVRIHWLEFRDDAIGWTEVNYATASRGGEPFASLIEKRSYLPNPVARYCTQELKIRVMNKWARAQGWDHWSSVVGIRADEPHRVARLRAANEAGKRADDVELPLADAKVSLADVAAFWKRQPFDLGLRAWEGNCDLCFLKSMAKRERIMRDRPDLAAWWIGQEEMRRDSAGRPATFRVDVPSYAALHRRVQAQPLLPFMLEEGGDDVGDCICHD